MRHFINAALMAALLPLTSAAADGGAGPGGGASYRIHGELKTLAQTGVIFERAAQLGSKVYPKYYDIHPEVIKQLEEIKSKLPETNLNWDNTNWASSSILADRDTFIDQKEISKPEYEKIKMDYRRVIQSYGKKLNELAFVLAAYGKKDATGKMKTYILPAFDEHNDFQQALLLIHEYFMRQPYYSKKDIADSADQIPLIYRISPTGRLALVLNLDVIILDILNNGMSDDSTLKFYEALYPLDGVSSERLGLFKLKLLQKKLGRPLLASDLVVNPMRGLELDPSLIQKFNSLIPGIAQGFEKGWELRINSAYVYPLSTEKEEEDFRAQIKAVFDRETAGEKQSPDAITKIYEIKNNRENERKAQLQAFCEQSGVSKSRVTGDFIILTDFRPNAPVELSCDSNYFLMHDIHLVGPR